MDRAARAGSSRIRGDEGDEGDEEVEEGTQEGILDDASLPPSSSQPASAAVAPAAKRHDHWTAEESFLLLDLWQKAYDGKKYLKIDKWEEIADKFSNKYKEKVPRSVAQCRERIRSLKKIYEKEKEEREKMRTKAITSQYYKTMDEIMSRQLVPQTNKPPRKKKDSQLPTEVEAQVQGVVKDMVKDLGQLPLIKLKGKEKEKEYQEPSPEGPISLALKQLGLSEEDLDSLTTDQYLKTLRDLALILAGCSYVPQIRASVRVETVREKETKKYEDVKEMITLKVKDIEGSARCSMCGTSYVISIDWRHGYVYLAAYVMGLLSGRKFPPLPINFECTFCNGNSASPCEDDKGEWNFLFLAFTKSEQVCPRSILCEHIQAEEEEVDPFIFYTRMLSKMDPTNVGWSSWKAHAPKKKVVADVQTVEEFQSQDRVMKETKDKKKAIKAYVYDLRNKLNGKFHDFVTAAEKDELITVLLQTVEDLLCDDGKDETKDVYVAKLEELKKRGDLIEERYKDHMERGAAVDQIVDCVHKEAAISDDNNPGPDGFSEVDWFCPKCHNFNLASRTTCYIEKCGTPRPSSRGDLIEKRYNDHIERGPAGYQLVNCVNNCKEVATSNDPKFDHIDRTEKLKVNTLKSVSREIPSTLSPLGTDSHPGSAEKSKENTEDGNGNADSAAASTELMDADNPGTSPSPA